MITYNEVLNLNYYKKAAYSGWMEGMRFLLRREETDGGSLFHVYAWPGPYIFEKTPDDQKIESTFPFTNDGKQAAVDWLNQQFEENRQLWPKHKTATAVTDS